MKQNQIFSGSFVLFRERILIVLRKRDNELIGCALVTASEPVHRADLVLEWHELVDAGLTHLDVRCRAIVMRRSISSVRWIGCVAPETVARIEAVALREAKIRRQEFGGQNTVSSRRTERSVGRPRRESVRAVWLDQGLMSCREVALRLV